MPGQIIKDVLASNPHTEGTKPVFPAGKETTILKNTSSRVERYPL